MSATTRPQPRSPSGEHVPRGLAVRTARPASGRWRSRAWICGRS